MAKTILSIVFGDTNEEYAFRSWNINLRDSSAQVLRLFTVGAHEIPGNIVFLIFLLVDLIWFSFIVNHSLIMKRKLIFTVIF